MNLIKATIAIAAITVCCMGNEYPAKAEYLRRTGESVYGGNSYNHGRYRTDVYRSSPGSEVIVDQSGNRWRCTGYGSCTSY